MWLKLLGEQECEELMCNECCKSIKCIQKCGHEKKTKNKLIFKYTNLHRSCGILRDCEMIVAVKHI